MGASISILFNFIVCLVSLGLVCDNGSSPIAAPASAVPGWYLGDRPGTSCDVACQDVGLVCNVKGLESMDEDFKMELLARTNLLRNVEGGNVDCDEFVNQLFEFGPFYADWGGEPVCISLPKGSTANCASEFLSGNGTEMQRFCCCTTEATDDISDCQV